MRHILLESDHGPMFLNPRFIDSIFMDNSEDEGPAFFHVGLTGREDFIRSINYDDWDSAEDAMYKIIGYLEEDN